MKLIPGLIFALAVTGVAHAEKFDLVCKGTLTTEIALLNDRSEYKTDFRFSVDTEAKLMRRQMHGVWEEVLPAEVFPDRPVMRIDPSLSYTINRVTGKVSSISKMEYAVATYDGDCKKAPFTPLPATKF